MPRVRVYSGNGVDEEQLRKLLEEAGCPVSGDSADDPTVEGSGSASTEDSPELSTEGSENLSAGPQEELDEECEPEVLIIVLTPELGDDDSLESELKAATARGCGVIGVWPQGTASGIAPPSFKKYSSDQVIWDPEAVRRAICGEGAEPAYQDPTGAPQPAVTTPRNCC